MWSQATFSVDREQDEVVRVIEAFFDSNPRYSPSQWSSSEQSIKAAGGRPGGSVARRFAGEAEEGMRVDFLPASDSDLELRVTSQSFPLFDWGRNAKNIRNLGEHLKASGWSVGIGPTASTHRIGGHPQL
jgi:hypothetical protein